MKKILIDTIFEDLDTVRKELTGKSKRKCQSIKEDIKQMYDKLFFEAYNDKRFLLRNYNKLILDLENMEKQKVYLMMIHIPKLQNEYFNDENKLAIATSFINKIKDISRKEQGCLFKSAYIASDYIIIIVDKENINRIYSMIKSIKEENHNYSEYQLYFNRYEFLSSSVNKNLKRAFYQANKVFSGVN